MVIWNDSEYVTNEYYFSTILAFAKFERTCEVSYLLRVDPNRYSYGTTSQCMNVFGNGERKQETTAEGALVSNPVAGNSAGDSPLPLTLCVRVCVFWSI